MLKSSRVKYFCDPALFSHFISSDVEHAVELAFEQLSEKVRIGVYPDATFERWGMPTGLLFTFEANDAVLFPTFLRDPGDGYLVFRMESSGLETGWRHAAGRLLDSIIRREALNPNWCNPLLLPGTDLQELILGGSREPWNWHNTIGIGSLMPMDSRSLEAEYRKLTCEERSNLENSFCTVTNTIEMKSIWQICDSDLINRYKLSGSDVIGFIHTGCPGFDRILEHRFGFPVAEYCLDHNLFSLNSVEHGIYGVPLNSELGNTYFHWIIMAERYAAANRYSVFQVIKDLFEREFPCKLFLLKDDLHCGIISDDSTQGSPLTKVFRGAQPLHGMSGDCDSLRLIAGHKETISALVAAGDGPDQSYDRVYDFVPHGTSWRLSRNQRYSHVMRNDEAEAYVNLAATTFYNSDHDISLCLPYTYNLLASVSYLADIGLIKTVALLAPLINVQGEKRIR